MRLPILLSIPFLGVQASLSRPRLQGLVPNLKPVSEAPARPIQHRKANENTKGTSSSQFIPDGVIELDFNPAYVVYDDFDDGGALVVSSFFNVALNPEAMMPNSTMTPFLPFERDLVARVTNLDMETPQVEVITDVTGGFPFNTVWPNIAQRAPDDVFPFEAVVVPQGWFFTLDPGRLVAIDVNTLEEFVIHQSTTEMPQYYHKVIFLDMDQDLYLDIVTVRSGFKLVPNFSPPTGELVWFRNPGPDLIQPDVEWEEHILIQGIDGPDVVLDAHDLDGDGVPEIMATHFFAGLPGFVGSPFGSPSRLILYGAPLGQTWAAVNASNPNSTQPRVADLTTAQDELGMVFSAELVDLDGDGRVDILCSNHQSQSDTSPGRVWALEQPASGSIFEEAWTLHILMDDIVATDTLPEERAERAAPGSAKSFHPAASIQDDRPWIALSGDAAGKAWVLKPTNETWVYEPHVIFDIDEYYGEGTTQTPLQDPFGITISTVGEIGIREEPDGATLFVPIFEAMDIHMFRYASPTMSPTDTPTMSPITVAAVGGSDSISTATMHIGGTTARWSVAVMTFLVAWLMA